MASVTGVALAGCLLLVVAGGAKVARPASLALALRAVGVPASFLIVRAVAVLEVVVGAGAVVWGGRPAWVAAAASYAGFTAFVLVVRRRGGALATCGCFGGPETPATVLHAMVTAGYAVVLVAAAVSPPELSRAARGDAVAIVVAAVAVAYLSYAVIAVVPQTRVLARPGRG